MTGDADDTRPPSSIRAPDRQSAADDARGRAVAAGLLDAAVAAEALEAWRREGAETGFLTWLVARGLLHADEVARLAAQAAGPGTPEVAPGDRLSGCTLERKLGQGGMGTVWAARRDADGLPVVVKLLHPQHARNPAWRARFAREGVVASQVHHENVVVVHAVDVEGPAPHIVMERVDGQDLADRLEEQGRVPPMEAARLARDVARGLAAAHAQGVVHRDVKPGNVRVTPAGEVKLLDFGLARGVETDDGLSHAGQVMGTPHYMPPEQWGDHRVDARGDVFSLGATLYHLVTGVPPFPGDRPMAVCRKALEGDFPRPRTFVPDLPEDLELVILRMMSRDRRCRYPTAAEAARDLDAVLSGEPVHVPALRERPGGRRHALLPGTSFVIGSDPACEVHVEGPAVAARHARVELARTGLRLADLGGGCLVNGLPVTRVQLKPGDVIAVGGVELVLDDAGLITALSGARPLEASSMRVRGVPHAVADALTELRDRRLVLAHLEHLPVAALERQVRSSREFLRGTYGDGALAEAVSARLAELLRARRARAAEALFRITHENLGDDEGEWLAWWEEAAHSYPPQLAAFTVRPRLRVRIDGDGPTRTVELGERLITRVGRAPECEVRLDDPSVSRHHAELVRLDARLVVRDEGSRYGTVVDGAPSRAAFLLPGDRVTLGRATLALEGDDPHAQPRAARDGSLLVDTELFDALVEARHESVAWGLSRFAVAPSHARWVELAAQELQAEGARAAALEAAITRLVAARAALAVEALPQVLRGLDPAAAPETMAGHAERLRAELAPQVVPIGWLPGFMG